MFNAEKETNNIIKFIRDYYKENNLGGVILGISGGKDSAVVAGLFTKALGKENVIGVTLPCHSNDEDKADAKLISDYFGFELINFDITGVFDSFKDELNNDFAAVFASYEVRNELGEYVRRLNINNLKYLVLIALEKGAFGQKSYRAIANGFDVGKIAEAHGGNGHPAAASVNITEEQKKFALILRKTSNRESIEYLVNSSYAEKK